MKTADIARKMSHMDYLAMSELKVELMVLLKPYLNKIKFLLIKLKKNLLYVFEHYDCKNYGIYS